MEYRIYRIFNKNEKLLYVGCTSNFKQRFIQHRMKQPWSSEIAIFRVSEELILDKKTALEKEREAIQNEHRIYNRVQGRRSMSGCGQSPAMHVRMSAEMLAKVAILGGAEWVRRTIKRARETTLDTAR